MHAAAGGQAIHLHRIVFDTSPQCFKSAVKRGEHIAHLFDQNYDRLVRTAKGCGVNVIVVEDKGNKTQHIDLCGKPLRKLRDSLQGFRIEGE